MMSCGLLAGQNATINGKVVDEDNRPVQFANVSIFPTGNGAATDKTGRFSIIVPAGRDLSISISFLGYEKYQEALKLKEGDVVEKIFVLRKSVDMLPGVDIEDENVRRGTLKRLNPIAAKNIPTAHGMEDVLKTQPGVVSNNELSSQYSLS